MLEQRKKLADELNFLRRENASLPTQNQVIENIIIEFEVVKGNIANAIFKLEYANASTASLK